MTLQTGRALPWPAPDPDLILGLPWSSMMALLLAALTILSSGAQLNRPAFYSKPQVLYEQYYRSVYTGLSEHLPPRHLIPWPDFTHGGLGWYRPGLREVERHANLIRALGDEKVPAIVLAAAIANQGSSAQRPFGIDLIERIQYFLGATFDWPLPGWEWGARWWRQHLEEPSLGIAQLLPDEARRLRGFGIPDLFDDRTSIRLMYAKLARVSDAAEALGLNQTQRFILLAIANNDGDGAIVRLTNYDLELERYIAEHPQTRIQIAKIMSFVDHLSQQGWNLPDGVNREYIWWLVNQSGGTP
ncbi:MAG TPA: hypothetical protein VNK95_14465 [Caldilineaceae bacterium]|nr:hypothetical protein [Caldilineaceae bacterium]